MFLSIAKDNKGCSSIFKAMFLDFEINNFNVGLYWCISCGAGASAQEAHRQEYACADEGHLDDHSALY